MHDLRCWLGSVDDDLCTEWCVLGSYTEIPERRRPQLELSTAEFRKQISTLVQSRWIVRREQYECLRTQQQCFGRDGESR